MLIFLIAVAMGLAGARQDLLPDDSLRPGTRLTIPAGQEREILFRPEGVRFLSGKARVTSLSAPMIDPYGRKVKEVVIDADDKSLGMIWIHDEKPVHLKIHAETDFTLQAREKWEETPQDHHPPGTTL